MLTAVALLAWPAAGATAASPPAPATPVELVRSLYDPYLEGRDGSGSVMVDDALAERVFSRALRAAFAAEAAKTPVDEVGAIDFDPLIDAQDFDLHDLEVKAEGELAEPLAAVLVTFRNLDRTSRLRYSLIREYGVWRVDDIAALSEPSWDLRDLLEHGWPEEPEPAPTP